MANTLFSDSIQIMAYIAFHPHQPVSSKALAKSVLTNPGRIRRIMAKLKSAGLIHSYQGKPHACLAKPASAISLRDIYLAVLGGQMLLKVDTNTSPNCEIGIHISKVLASYYLKIQAEVENKLDQTTLEDLVADLKLKESRQATEK